MFQPVCRSYSTFNPASYLNSTVGYMLVYVELPQLLNVKPIKPILKTVYVLNKQNSNFWELPLPSEKIASQGKAAVK